MARNSPNERIGRLFRHPSGQDDMFDKSYEEKLDARGGEPVECLGLTFENEETRRSHFLGKLREGLEELHAKLGGVPYTGLDDTAARMAEIEHWPMGEGARLRRLAERMSHADSSKDLLQRWEDEVGFPHGEIEDILDLSDPPWHTACPNPFLIAFVEVYGSLYDPGERYRRKPFAVDVSEGKTHPVYRAHGYHTKVPTSCNRAFDPSLHRARRFGSGRFRRYGHDRGGGTMVRLGAGELPEGAGSVVGQGGFRHAELGSSAYNPERSLAARRFHRRQLRPAIRSRRVRQGWQRASRRGRDGSRLDV